MGLPNYPDKYASAPVVTPDQHNDYHREYADSPVEEPPEAVVLCYSRRLMNYFVDAYDGQEVGHYYGRLYVFEDTDYRVGVLGDFGIGAPTATMLLEELVADGVEAVLSIGFAGCLVDDVEMGEFVVCDRAVRDEGTSHHYVPPERWAHASDALVERTETLLADREESYHVGPSWTTDAMYQETAAEVADYADEGVLTVEMEASAVFAVADYRGVNAGAMFVVSDYLGTDDWDPKFHLVAEDVRRLGDTAKDVLDAHVRR